MSGAAETSDVEIGSAPPGSPTSQNAETSTTTLATAEGAHSTGAGRQKRHRDDMGPTTPRGDEESKVLGGLTPLAKKGRVQPDSRSNSVAADVDDDDDEEDEHNERRAASSAKDEDDDADVNDDEDDDETQVTPPRSAPKGLETHSPPPTPMQAGDARSSARAPEGQETKAIRKRVANLEWKDGEQPHSATMVATNESDVEIAEVAAEVAESAEMAEGEHAQVADEVSESAKQLAAQDEREADSTMAEQEANVAADVAVTAKMLAKEDEAKQDEDQQIAEVASEVAASAKKVDRQDAEERQAADVAAEVAESAKIVAPETPTKPTPSATASTAPLQTSFSAFSSTASPFAAVSGASPLSSVSKSPVTKDGEERPEQQPKSRTTFGSAPLTSSPMPTLSASKEITSFEPKATTTEASEPVASTSSSIEPVAAAPAPALAPSPAPAVALTPKPVPSFTKSESSSTFAPSTLLSGSKASTFSTGASAFSAFASTSGFSAATHSAASSSSTTRGTGGGGAFGASSSSTGSGFGSFSSGASPFANLTSKRATSEEDTSSRKMGEPEEVDESKRVFTEQEVVTGEEEDELVHSVRSKLFVMQEGAWVERGVGLLRLNRTRHEDKKGARLVMRADATHRLLLNATLFAKFSIEVNQEKYVRFAIIENGEPISYMLRMSGPATANALVKAVQDEVERLE